MLKIIFFLITIVASGLVQATQLIQLRIEGSTLILQLDSALSPKIFELHSPERFVIDMPHSTIKHNIPHLMRQANYMIRLGEHVDGTVRVVIESASPINARPLPSTNPRELRYQLGPSYASVNTTKPQALTNFKPRGSNTAPWAPKTRVITVVIDPGHGGKDPGAFGFHRTPEKQVVLSIAKRLKQKIDSYPGMRAILTRDSDYFIDLRRRLDISRRCRPDIFVAIHADAFTNPQSHGASVFALSPKGATSEAARWLAEKENHSELGGVNLRDLDDQNGMVRSVLIDLSQTATIQASLKMGQNVLNQMGQITSLHNRRVEQARFVVLKSPDTPSILVETGFISNPAEEKRLASAEYQAQLSQAIFKGIHQYFQDYPPRGHRI